MKNWLDYENPRVVGCSLKFICQKVTTGFPHRQVPWLLPLHIFTSYLDDKQNTLLSSLWMKPDVEEDNMPNNRVAVQWGFNWLGLTEIQEVQQKQIEIPKPGMK